MGVDEAAVRQICDEVLTGLDPDVLEYISGCVIDDDKLLPKEVRFPSDDPQAAVFPLFFHPSTPVFHPLLSLFDSGVRPPDVSSFLLAPPFQA